MWATIIIAESFTRIMGSAAGNTVYYRRRRFLQYNFMDPGWGGQNFPRGAWQGPGPGPLAGAGAVYRCPFPLFRCAVTSVRFRLYIGLSNIVDLAVLPVARCCHRSIDFSRQAGKWAESAILSDLLYLTALKILQVTQPYVSQGYSQLHLRYQQGVCNFLLVGLCLS